MSIPKVKNIVAHQFEAVAAGDGYVVLDTTSGRAYTPERSYSVARQQAHTLNNALAHSRRALATALGSIAEDDEDNAILFDLEVPTYA